MQTVQIPGGTAVMFNKQSELTPRRRRPVELLSARIGRKVNELRGATRVLCDGAVVIDHSDQLNEDGTQKFEGGDVEVTEKELTLTMRLNDVVACSLLASWTLDISLPTCEDEFLDIPSDVYDALVKHAAAINADMANKGDEFSPDAIEDPASPTGD